jgi:hypothetical protein
MTRLLLVPAVLASAVAAGCGGSGHNAAPSATVTTSGSASATTTSASGGGPGALQAEANATAAGDIPDNQTFLVFRNGTAGYSIKYPEGWAQQGSGSHVSFGDKGNIVRVVVGPAAAPTTASVGADLAHLHGAQLQGPPQKITISGRPAIKAAYSTRSAPNAVTGKRVKFVVDRYYLWKGGRRAVVELGTPQGVDNVDAYRLMIESFRWS